MGFVELFLIAVGLSMDAFAVAVGKGLSMKQLDLKQGLIIALFFGGFQALMPVIGWALGAQFAQYVESLDHWIAFVLLAFIGGKMIVDTLRDDSEAENENKGSKGNTGAEAQAREEETSTPESQLDLKELLILAIATSIDALAMGVTFAFLQVNIVYAVTVVGITTFALSLAGVVIGHQFGARWEKLSALAGGIVLIVIGCKILIEHLFF